MADRTILIDHLQSAFGVRDSDFDWIESFLVNYSQTVSFAGGESAVSLVLCGIPQGSAPGPMLFLLYCMDVTNIAESHGVTAHSTTRTLKTASCTFTARLSSAQQRSVN